MLKKGVICAGIFLVGALGILVFCNKSNPAAPTPADITGKWSGMAVIQTQGAALADTFTAVLSITQTGYSLLRGRTFFSSSPLPSRDSSREVGSWAKSASGDSVILSPNSAADSCFYYDGIAGVWIKCDGTIDAQFKECQPPIHIKIDITGNVWSNVSIVRYDDYQKSVSFNLTKN